MTLLLIIVALLITISIAVFFVMGVFRPIFLPPGASYEKRVFLSAAELRFYHSLVVSAGSAYVVLSKVRVADLVQVAGGYVPESDEWWKRFGPIAKKHIDFVLYDPKTMEPLVLIELEDRSHLTEKAQKRDAAVNSIMQEANYPLIHIPVGARGYDTKALSKLIEQTQFAARRAAIYAQQNNF